MSEPTYAKALPVPDELSAPFWQFLQQGELSLQQCSTCARYQFFPRASCSHCGALEVGWRTVSGDGTVYAMSVVHRTRMPGWRDEVPYVLALVELVEGPRLQTNIIDCSPDAVHIGLRVRVRPTPAAGGMVLPLFAPAGTDMV